MELTRAAKLGQDIEQVWAAPTTTVRDRKRLLRCLIEEVQLRSQKERYHVTIVWKGGAITERELRRFASGGQAHATPLDTVELVRKLAIEFDDAQIARILNRQGRRSGLGRERDHGALPRKTPGAPRREARHPGRVGREAPLMEAPGLLGSRGENQIFRRFISPSSGGRTLVNASSNDLNCNCVR
jgi:hypothetical protein